jgi:Uma2 family endonuclease
MSQSTDERLRWTTSDLDLLPDNGNRYEIIDGELFVSRAPHWEHQVVCGNIYTELKI